MTGWRSPLKIVSPVPYLMEAASAPTATKLFLPENIVRLGFSFSPSALSCVHPNGMLADTIVMWGYRPDPGGLSPLYPVYNSIRSLTFHPVRCFESPICGSHCLCLCINSFSFRDSSCFCCCLLWGSVCTNLCVCVCMCGWGLLTVCDSVFVDCMQMVPVNQCFACTLNSHCIHYLYRLM